MSVLRIAAFLLPFISLVLSLDINDIINNDEETETFLSPDDFITDFEPENVTDVLLQNGIELQSDDPLERARKFEGDIEGFTEQDADEIRQQGSSLERNGIRSRWQQWTGGKIPYILSSRYGKYSRRTIARAMEVFHKYTCIRFVPRTDERNYVYIRPVDGCYSLVGRVGGRQTLSLDAGCIELGTVLHELNHVVGFFHEQSRSDRDDYIKIVWDNVLEDAKDQFEKYGWDTITHLGTEYDYGSLMHYSPYAFSKNSWLGKKTIVALKDGGDNMGQRDGFSKTDVIKINRMYQCDESDIKESIESLPDVGSTGSSLPTVVGGTCKDKSWNCMLKSVLGWCSDDYRTQKECPRTCGTCEKTNSGRPSRPSVRSSTEGPSGEASNSGEAPVESSGDCTDNRDKCPEYAAKGRCEKYKNFMGTHCRLSCKLCTPSTTESPQVERNPTIEVEETTPSMKPESTEAPTTCEDSNPNCGRWSESSRNFCDRFESYMRKRCSKSCNFCGSETKTLSSPEPAVATLCVNKNSESSCARWAKKGYCDNDRNGDLMKKYCAKSCGSC